MVSNTALPRQNRDWTHSFDTYGAWGSDDSGVPYQGTYSRSLSVEDDGCGGEWDDAERMHFDRDRSSQLQNGMMTRLRDGDGDDEYDASARRHWSPQDQYGTASQYPHDDTHHASYHCRSTERHPWIDQPVYPLNDHGCPSIERSARHSERCDPIDRSNGEGRRRAFGHAGYSGDGFWETPLLRWERGSSRERPWDGVGGVTTEGYDNSFWYGNSGAHTGVGAGGYGWDHGSRSPEYWGSDIADVGNDRTYAERRSSHGSRIRR